MGIKKPIATKKRNTDLSAKVIYINDIVKPKNTIPVQKYTNACLEANSILDLKYLCFCDYIVNLLFY